MFFSISGIKVQGCLNSVLFLPQDLEGKIIVDELKQEVISTSSKAEPPQCTSLAWSADGQVSGCTIWREDCGLEEQSPTGGL